MARIAIICFLLITAACDDDPVATASSVESLDAGESDAGEPDAGEPDVGESTAGLGSAVATSNVDPYPDAPSELTSWFFSCGRSEGCIEEGLCSYRTECKMPETPEDDGPCGTACRVHGLCVKTARGCVATREEHCRDSNHCFRYGICSLAGDRCVAKTDEDCEQSIHCEANGLCSAVRGACVAVDDDDCEKSCAMIGKCHAVDGMCQALDDDDCAIPCRERGVCDRQVHNVIGVGLSREMKSVGTCGYGDNPPCNESVVCRVEGRCGFAVKKDLGHPWRLPTGECVATEEGCENSENCKALGACHVGFRGECTMVDVRALIKLRESN